MNLVEIDQTPLTFGRTRNEEPRSNDPVSRSSGAWSLKIIESRPSAPSIIGAEKHHDLAYQWFCRLGLEDAPEHSTFAKNRHGRFRDSDVLHHVFETVLGRCMSEGLDDPAEAADTR